MGVLSKQAFQRGLMIVEELGKGLGFMFGMSERERERLRLLAVTSLSVEQPSCMNDLSLSLSVESL